MSDETNDPVSLDERRRKRAEDAILEGLKPAQTLAKQMWDECKKRMDYIATSFGLDEPYNDEVLSLLLFACEGFEEPPFKLYTDIGWLWRGYCLAYNVASSIEAHASHPNNPRYPAWPKEAAKVFAEAGDYWHSLLTKREYGTMQSLLSVPDGEHAELQEIVNGLSLFSERRWGGKCHRYLCLVRAIIEACEEASQ